MLFVSRHGWCGWLGLLALGMLLLACDKKPVQAARRNLSEDPVKRLLKANALELATLEPRFGEFDSIQAKVDAFLVAPPASLLKLTEHELALYLTGGPDEAELRESAVWGIALDDEGKSQLCLDTALSLKGGGMQGKFLNARFYVSMIPGAEGLSLDVPGGIVGDQVLDSYELIMVTDLAEVRRYLWESPRLQALMRSSKSFTIDGMSLVFCKR